MQQLTLFTEHYQPRFQAYLDHMNVTDKSEVKMHEFIIWIGGHAEDFKQANNIGTLNGRHEEFDEYVRKQVRENERNRRNDREKQ